RPLRVDIPAAVPFRPPCGERLLDCAGPLRLTPILKKPARCRVDARVWVVPVAREDPFVQLRPAGVGEVSRGETPPALHQRRSRRGLPFAAQPVDEEPGITPEGPDAVDEITADSRVRAGR